MYIHIGAFDAKAKLSELLREVKHGQRYTITLRGHPIADLIPNESSVYQNAHAAVETMRSIRKVPGVSPKMVTEWITEGRRWTSFLELALRMDAVLATFDKKLADAMNRAGGKVFG